MSKHSTDLNDFENLSDLTEESKHTERAIMPVGRDARARGASRATWRTPKVSKRNSRTRSGIHRRRRKRIAP